MKILILNADYGPFLVQLYGNNPGLQHASYQEQLSKRHASLFGLSNFYSKNFSAIGCHNAQEIYVNNIWLQLAWAREHGMQVPNTPNLDGFESESILTARLKRILRPYKNLLAPIAVRLGFTRAVSGFLETVLLAQIEHYSPDLILNQDIAAADVQVVKRAQKKGRVLVAQHGVDLPPSLDVSIYNFGISHIPSVLQQYVASGIPGYLVNLGFEPSVLTQIGDGPEKDIDVSFVGSLAPNHRSRIRFLEELARLCPVELFVSNTRGLPQNSPLLRKRQGEVWGADMYRVLRRSKITLNTHIDAAKGMAGNLRMYESTGVGTLLLTEDFSNVPTLFDPDELVTYRNAKDCAEKIQNLLTNGDRLREIATAGQKKTLQAHTYAQRTRQIVELVEAAAS